MAKIFERNPDTGEIRSREMHQPTKAQQAISRSEILDEILSDVCNILGEDYAREESETI